MLPIPLPPGEVGFFALAQFNGTWRTLMPKQGHALDTGWPEYLVKKMEEPSSPGSIVARGESMFFRYDIDDVISQAPKDANAYYISTEPQRTIVDGKGAIVAEVVFCRIVLDETCKAVPEDVLTEDYNLQMNLLERFERSRHRPQCRLRASGSGFFGVGCVF